MKFGVVRKLASAGTLGLSVTLGLVGCGGGGSSGDTASDLRVSGTAATGAALAGASVSLKCATGSGSASTDSAGGYSVTLAGAALPCIVRVTGTNAAGASVILHSVTEAGTSAGSTTSATANITPVTEMILAQVVATLPTEAFDSFDPQRFTKDSVAAAATAIVAALKDAGVDLGGIDPLKAALVPASGSTPGNGYDQALDRLGQVVGAESLPLVVNQIATAAASSSSTGLANAMAAVSGGALADCPWAVSGKYRTVSYTGIAQVHTVDFRAMTWQTEGAGAQTITAGSRACEFSVGSTTVVIGQQGAGAFHTAGMTGFVFPMQPQPLAAAAGTWNFVESGLNENNEGEHWFGRFTVQADGSASVCDYNPMGGVASFGDCLSDPTESVALSAAADGSFLLTYKDNVSTHYGKAFGYKGPSGVLSLFGTNNPDASTAPSDLRSHFVMVKAGPLAVQPAGTVSRYWDVLVGYANGALGTDPVTADSITVIASDAAASTVTRQRASDGRTDTFRVNYPVEGMRYRAATSTLSAIYQVQVPSLGLAISFDDMPAPRHFYSVSVSRP